MDITNNDTHGAAWEPKSTGSGEGQSYEEKFGTPCIFYTYFKNTNTDFHIILSYDLYIK